MLLRAACIVLVAAPLSAAAFTVKSTARGAAVHWPDRAIDFIVGATDDAAKDAQLITAAARATAAWSSTDELSVGAFGPEPSAAIGFTVGGGNVITWSNEASKVDDAGILALTVVHYRTDTGEIHDADVLINDVDHTWVDAKTRATPGAFDLANTLTHELGHAIGLDHSDEASATMFSSSPAMELAKRDLAPDDVDAVRALYGALPSLERPVMPEELSQGCRALAPLDPIIALGGVVLAWLAGRRRRAPRDAR